MCDECLQRAEAISSLWHPVPPKPKALYVETHTFLQFLLRVVVGERSASGKIIVCVTHFPDQKREAGQKRFWHNFWNAEYSHFFSLHPMYSPSDVF